MRMTQRLTAMLLSLCLLLPMFPSAALAEDAAPDESFDEVFSESFTSEPAFTEEPTAEPTFEPTAEPTEAPTAEPTAEPTEVPTTEPTAEPTEVPTTEPTAEPTETPTAEPVIVEKADFIAGLARLSSGARLYEHKGLWGVYVETTTNGVVYASEQSDDEKAIRVSLNNGVSLWEGWVKADLVSMLTPEQSEAYDLEERDEEIARSYRGHLLMPISTISSEPTPEPEPVETEEIIEGFVPMLTPEPTEEAPPANEVPDAIPSQEPAGEPEDEVFTEAAPEVTVEPLPEPSFEPDDAEEVSKFVEYRALEAPANLSATHTRLGVMTLTWDGVENTDAYQVLYKASHESEYRVLTTVKKTTCSTADLDPSVVYYFRVRAVELGADGSVLNASPHSASCPYIVLGDTKIDDPRGKDSSTIRLTWSEVAGATHYDVMMSVHNANDWHIVRTDLVTKHCDIANISFDETYDFRVIPKRKLSNGTVITGNSSRVAMVGSPMETPSFQQYEWTEKGLKLTWDAIPGASGYVIYRRAFSETDVTNYQKLVVLDEPVTTYTDTAMVPGEVYYYFVYSFKLAVPEGWRCFSLKGEIGMGVWLPKATDVLPEDITGQGVKLSWPRVAGASHYDVSISRTSGPAPTGNGNGRVSVPSGFHSTAKLGTTYYYRVRPVRLFSNGDVSVGPWSDEIAHTYQEAESVYRALVIGNTYPNETNQLPGCDNDAKAVSSMLRRMSGTPYSVNTQLNLSDSGIINAIRTTFADAKSNDISLFYFSGHGANTPETSFHGALVGVYHTYLSVSRLKQELDSIPGKKIVIIDSCHSGQMIGKSTDNEVTSAELSAFNSSVVSIFASDENTIVRSVEDALPEVTEERFTEQPMLIARGENDLANSGYYVITAAHSTEKSVSMGYDSNGDNKAEKYFGLFTYGLCHGSGWNIATETPISTLHADRDGNSEITLYEAYLYAKAMAQRSNPNQTAQIYPANSGLVIWKK